MKIVNAFKPLTFLTKSSILDASVGYEHGNTIIRSLELCGKILLARENYQTLITKSSRSILKCGLDPSVVAITVNLL